MQYAIQPPCPECGSDFTSLVRHTHDGRKWATCRSGHTYTLAGESRAAGRLVLDLGEHDDGIPTQPR